MFAGRTCHFVGFVMRWHIYCKHFLEATRRQFNEAIKIARGN